MKIVMLIALLAVAVMGFIGGGNAIVADGGGDFMPKCEFDANFGCPDLNITVDGGGDYSPVTEPPVIVVDGGGDRSDDSMNQPVIVVDGGGDRAPDMMNPPVILVDGGGDYAPEIPDQGRNA